jgi:hypothetical protein
MSDNGLQRETRLGLLIGFAERKISLVLQRLNRVTWTHSSAKGLKGCLVSGAKVLCTALCSSTVQFFLRGRGQAECTMVFIESINRE